MPDANTKLLLHMNSDFSDSSDSNHTPTVNGATIDTGIKKFGAGSGKFVSASNQYISYPDHADWAFGSDDFTIDAQIRFSSLTGVHSIISQHYYDGFWNDAAFQFWWLSNILYFQSSTNGVTKDMVISKAWSPSIDIFYHIAMVRSGSDYILFANGVSLGSATVGSAALHDSSRDIWLAASNTNGSPTQTFNGYIDEMRISNVARWTSGFTPPTLEYNGVPPSGDVPIFRRRIEGE